MTNLPKELGVGIFKQILNTPKPDYAKMDAEAKELEKRIMEARQKRNVQCHSAE